MQRKLNLFRQIGKVLILLGLFALFQTVQGTDFGGIESAFAQESAQPAVPASGSTGEAPAGRPAQPGWGSMLMPFILMFAVIYFLMIRPQQKRMKQHQQMLGTLKRGDDVVTSSGLLGKVKGITDKVITLEIDDNVHVRLLKSQVNSVVTGPVQDIQQS